jgi:hypothetical protein
VRAPAGSGLDQSPLHGRVTIEAQEAVRPEIGQDVIADPHPPLFVHGVDPQILEMDVGHVVQEQHCQPHDPIAAQVSRQLLDGVPLGRISHIRAFPVSRLVRSTVCRRLRNHVHLAVHLVSSHLTLYHGLVHR